MRFEFFTPARIILGPGTLAEVGPLARSLGQRALLVTGTRPEPAGGLKARLQDAGVFSEVLRVHEEPTTELIEQGLDLARRAGCDLVIGFGGGSSIDSAKAIAALLANPGELLDYLEVIGRAQPLARPGLPCIAIPTTAGTGAEVTRNAVLASPAHRVKVSLRSPFLVPRLAVVDPELTYSLPPAITATTGMDALTQVIEPYVSARAQPLTDALCADAIARAAHALPRAYADGQDTQARADMSLVSLIGGLALANAGLGVVHGFAGVLGGMFPAPHGAVCARLLPFVAAANMQALRAREPDGRVLRRYDEVARLLTGDSRAEAADGVRWLQHLIEELHIPPLADYGLTPADLPTVVGKALAASSTKANPIALTEDEMLGVLDRAL